MENAANLNKDNWLGVDVSKVGSVANIKANQEFDVEEPKTESAKQAYESVLKKAGAIYPKRDEVDTRIMNELSGKTPITGSGKYGVNKGIIDSQKSLGGWPELKSVKAPEDTDHDGMPDAWEKANKLDPKNPEDRNNRANDGYTMLEKYLNSLITM